MLPVLQRGVVRCFWGWRGLDCPKMKSMVMQKKLRKVIAYVARVQDFSLKGPSPKGQGHGSLDAALLRWFKTIPGVGSEVRHRSAVHLVCKFLQYKSIYCCVGRRFCSSIEILYVYVRDGGFYAPTMPRNLLTSPGNPSLQAYKPLWSV